MPTNQRQQTTPHPPTTKYKNKDGSKLIAVPKSSTTSSSEPSPAMALHVSTTHGHLPATLAVTNGSAPAVNRKKQKRREKQAAKLAAQSTNDANGPSNGVPTSDVKKQIMELEAQFREHGLNDQYEPAGRNQYFSDEEGDAYSDSYDNEGLPLGYGRLGPTGNKRLKHKKKSRDTSDFENHYHQSRHGHPYNHVSLPLPPMPASTMQRGPGISKEKIWNTSSQEERERIKEFWLSLGEDERKSLVKVEKDAVLRKMKEQQKHSCSCTVCGRKRTAIEEELEVLYDAYYEELEQYANHQGEDGMPPMLSPPRRFGALSGLQPPNRLPPTFTSQQPSRGRIVEQLGDDVEDDLDEEYSEDEGDEYDYSEDEPPDLPRNHAADFFNFGNSLTVQGGILTVADDLLKNDGKKFIEMMEQLAERRMAREEDAHQQYPTSSYNNPPAGAIHTHSHTHPHPQPHNHSPPPPPEEDEDDEEDEEEEEYDSQEDDYDDEQLDTMTEEQRMEEGRRMFQIFAARMFEQRVLTAYKEKVAKERQQKLLEELEEESRADSQKKAKKAKEAQKRKDKNQQKKQALAEEKAKRENEKAAEEAALRAQEEKRSEEQRQRAEEKRKKKEAQRKADEDERLRKELDKQKRLQEQREKQAEVERKQRGTKEREKKEKEELRQKEREAKEAREHEVNERKEKQEDAKREKEIQIKSEKEAREKQKRKEIQAQQAAAQAANAAAQATKRNQPPHSIPIPASVSHIVGPSPHMQVATPVSKAPAPNKLRTSSQQGSNGSIPATPLSGPQCQTVSPHPSTPLQGNPGQGLNTQHPFSHHPQATSPIHAALKGPPAPIPGIPFQQVAMTFQPGMSMMGPGFGGRSQEPTFPHQPFAGQFRPMVSSHGLPLHPTINMHETPPGRSFPVQQQPPPGFAQQLPNGLVVNQTPSQKEVGPPPTHSRHESSSLEKPFEPHVPVQAAQPIARPGPIGRPSSVVHGSRQRPANQNDIDDLSNHLGSSALLDDSDETYSRTGARRSSLAPGNMPRQNFAPAPFAMDPAFVQPIHSYNTWGGQTRPFAPSSLPGQVFAVGWGAAPVNSSFGSICGPPAIRSSQPRSVAVRLMICRVCKSLEGSTPDGFLDINVIKDHVDILNQPNEQPVSEKELLDICDTEGNSSNGGGFFLIRPDSNERHSIRYEVEAIPKVNPNTRPVGAPGSPVAGAVPSISRYHGGPPGF